MEDIKQAIIGYDWNDEKKGRAINRLTPETVAKLSGLPPGVMKAALEDDLASGEAAIVAEAPSCHCQQILKARFLQGTFFAVFSALPLHTQLVQAASKH